MYELDGASVRVEILEAALDIAGTRGEPAVTLEEVANSLQRPLSDIEEEFPSSSEVLEAMPNFPGLAFNQLHEKSGGPPSRRRGCRRDFESPS